MGSVAIFCAYNLITLSHYIFHEKSQMPFVRLVLSSSFSAISVSYTHLDVYKRQEESRVYPSFFDACTPLWISENPLLWFSEQPKENKKSKSDFQTPGLSEIQMSLYRSVYCRTTESRMEL